MAPRDYKCYGMVKDQDSATNTRQKRNLGKEDAENKSYYINSGSSSQLKAMCAQDYKMIRKPVILTAKKTQNCKNQSQLIFYPCVK